MIVFPFQSELLTSTMKARWQLFSANAARTYLPMRSGTTSGALPCFMTGVFATAEQSDRAVSYNLQKNFDGAASMGPCIVVGELDQQNIDVETRVNGTVRQSYNTSEMIWSFGEVLEYLSQDFTFVPGDVIAGGTSAGTAADKSRRSADGRRPIDLFLKIGDVVEVSSPQVGALANQIVSSE